jgi:hypothetical protein
MRFIEGKLPLDAHFAGEYIGPACTCPCGSKNRQQLFPTAPKRR